MKRFATKKHKSKNKGHKQYDVEWGFKAPPRLNFKRKIKHRNTQYFNEP